jgi:hypothetical protein
MCKLHNNNKGTPSNAAAATTTTMTMNDDTGTIAVLTEEVFIVPTKGPSESEPKKVIDIDTSSLTEEDLKTLKKQDPFLYYSIPSVRPREGVCGSVGNKGIDVSSSLQMPSGSSRVERRSCISFECHPDLLFDGCSSTSDYASVGDGDASYDGHTMDVDFESSIFDELLRRHNHKHYSKAKKILCVYCVQLES